jgi:serine/threonine-protein kinase RsbW
MSSGAGDETAVLRIGVALEDLGRLYPWLDDAAAARQVPRPTVQKMHVAGEITIRLLASPEAAALVVEDAGPAFDPTMAAPRPRAASLQEARPGGLGLTLLRHYCSDIGYERRDDRNRLTLRFPLTPA